MTGNTFSLTQVHLSNRELCLRPDTIHHTHSRYPFTISIHHSHSPYPSTTAIHHTYSPHLFTTSIHHINSQHPFTIPIQKHLLSHLLLSNHLSSPYHSSKPASILRLISIYKNIRALGEDTNSVGHLSHRQNPQGFRLRRSLII